MFKVLSVVAVSALLSTTALAQLPPRSAGTPSPATPAPMPLPAPAPTANPQIFNAPNSGPFDIPGAVPMQGGGGGGSTSVDPGTVSRAQSQARGDFGSLDRPTGLPLGMTQDAWRTPQRSMAQGQSAPGVVRFNWSQELIMQIRIRTFMVTSIVLPEWEKIVQVYSGEQAYMEQQIPRPNVLMLRSPQSGIDTNVTVIGESGNLYNFYVRSEGFNTRQLTDLQVFVNASAPNSATGWQRGANGAGFRTSGFQAMQQGTNQAPTTVSLAQNIPGPTPTSTGAPGGAATAVDSPVRQGSEMLIPRDQMTFNMSLFEVNPGDKEIAPEYIYTDGVWTYFHFGTRARSIDRPVILRVVDGIETRVNTRTAGRFGEVVIAEALGDFVLRSGARIVCAKVRRDPAR